MRRCAPLLALALVLTGCGREPSFDERYEKAEKAIREKAQAIDDELAARNARQARRPAEPAASAPAAAGPAAVGPVAVGRAPDRATGASQR